MKFILFIAIILLKTSFCVAQTDTLKENSPWKFIGSYGFGTGFNYTYTIGIAADAIVMYEKQAVILRGNYSVDIPGGDIVPITKIEEYALIYGHNVSSYLNFTNSLAIVGAGVGYASGNRRGAFKGVEEDKSIFGYRHEVYETVPVSAFGLALEAQFIKTVFSWGGIGTSFFANINTQRNVIGMNLMIYAGKF